MRILFISFVAILSTSTLYGQEFDDRDKFLIGDFIVKNIDTLSSYYIISIEKDQDIFALIATQKENNQTNVKYKNKKNIQKIEIGKQYFFYLKNYLYLDYRSIHDPLEPLIFDNTIVWTKENEYDVFFTPNLDGLYYKPFSLHE